MNLRTVNKLTRRRWTALPMPKEVIDHVNKLGEADGQPYILTFYDLHDNPVGDKNNPNAYLTDEPEEETEEDEPVPEIVNAPRSH